MTALKSIDKNIRKAGYDQLASTGDAPRSPALRKIEQAPCRRLYGVINH